jgi:hypothetical protein
MAFLAIADEIRVELKAGAFLTTIYATRRAELRMSYSQFARLVQRYLSGSGRTTAIRTQRPRPVPRASPVASRRAGEPLKLVLAAPAALLDRREASGNGTNRRNHEAVGEDELI